MPLDDHPYFQLLRARATEDAMQWFERSHQELTLKRFPVAYAGAGRRLGPQPVVLSDAERLELEKAGTIAPVNWPLRDVGRCLLLLRSLELISDEEPTIPGSQELKARSAPPDVTAFEPQVTFIDGVYRKSDNAEREALLKSLCLMRRPERFVDIAVDACRSHVQSVFEAIACENPYPAAHFPDLHFNQMVLKAFFTGVKVKRIVGLEKRRTNELARMANDYADERRAAGRPVPEDLHLVTT